MIYINKPNFLIVGIEICFLRWKRKMRTGRTREVGDRDRSRVYMKLKVARDAETEKRKERR